MPLGHKITSVTESLERIMECRSKIDALQQKIDAEMTHLIIADPPESRPRIHRMAQAEKKKQVVKKKLKRK